MTDRSEPSLPVAIVGAGFSGTLLAINLLRLGARVVLVERDHVHLARGLAYGTRRPEHLLNVRASNMSAFPDDAGHFLRWLGFEGMEQANRFAPRMAYGRYLRELLVEALSSAPDRITIKQQEAVDIAWRGDAPTMLLDSGERVPARAVVLALGNAQPAPFAPFAHLPAPTHHANPWSPGATDAVESVQDVLLLGTGLTAIDVAISLDDAGFRGRIAALSRRGLRHQAHAAAGPTVSMGTAPSSRGSWLIHQVRSRASDTGWRQAIDELRPHTQDLWRNHDHAAQARFLRHLRPWWDIHRHRLAPEVAARVDAMEREGRLEFIAAKVISAEADKGRVRVRFRKRGSDSISERLVDRIVSCTGSSGDIFRAPQSLIGNLLEQGRIRPDPHRLGIDVDRDARVKRRNGQTQANLYAVGPPTKGEAWEIVAVPDIRRQVADLACLLSG